MITQEFDINIVPHGLPPRVAINQYDTGLRTLIAHVYQDDVSIPMTSAYTYTVCGTKPSGTGFSYPATVQNGAIVFDVTGQMSVVAGPVRCGILVQDGDNVVGTLAFILDVQKAALTTDTIIDSDDFGSIITTEVRAWMDEHGIPIDSNLENAGMAADAKATGDAIRFLDSSLKNGVLDWSELADSTHPTGFRQGYYGNTSGGYNNSGYWLCTRDLFKAPFTDFDSIIITPPAENRLWVSEYDSTKTFIKSYGGSSESYNGKPVQVVITPGNYYSVTVGRFSNSASYNTKAFLSTFVCETIQVNQGVCKYRGNVKNLGYTSLAQCVADGWYQVIYSYTSNITDLPDNYPLDKSGFLEVRPYTSIDSGTNNAWQILKVRAGGEWRRFISNGTPDNWVCVDFSTISDKFLYRGKLSELGYTALSQCGESGWYWVDGGYISNLTDLPGSFGTSGGARLSVYPSGTSGWQILEKTDGSCWKRFNSNGTYGSWYTYTLGAAVSYLGSMTEYGVTDLNSFSHIGYAQIRAAEVSGLAHMPSDYPGGAALIFNWPSTTGLFQRIERNNGDEWRRYIGASIGAWTHITETNADSLFSNVGMYSRIAVCGASWDSGYYYTTGGGGPYINRDKSWLAVLAKKYGVNYGCYGVPSGTTCAPGSPLIGQNGAVCWQTNANGLPKLLSDDPCDLYVIRLNGNDQTKFGVEYIGEIEDIHEDYTENPDTFYGNYGRILDQIIAHSPMARIIITMSVNWDTVSDSGRAFAEALTAIATKYGLPMWNWMDDVAYQTIYSQTLIHNHPTLPANAGMSEAAERLFSQCVQKNQAYFNAFHD